MGPCGGLSLARASVWVRLFDDTPELQRLPSFRQAGSSEQIQELMHAPIEVLIPPRGAMRSRGR